MRRILPVLALFALGGCFHARQVERSDDDAPAESAPRGTTRPATPARPGQPPVATSPTGLLREDALEDIQKALHERGYLADFTAGKMDEPTSAAVRRFQKDHDLAQTGVPDHETVRRLELDPERVYKAAAPETGAASAAGTR